MSRSDSELHDPAASVRQRLLNLSKERAADYQLLLARYAAERFLYRLGESGHAGRFILKGALLFSLWTEEEFRATRDVDLLGDGSADKDAVQRAVQAICLVQCPDDGIRFDPSTVQVRIIRGEQEYGGVRATLRAYLGRTRIPLQVDVGFGDAVTPAPEVRAFPTLLGHKAPHIKTYPIETVVAEKYEAMVRLGAANSRMKDFWDIAAIASKFSFDGATLLKAVAATFARRSTPGVEDLPLALRPEFYEESARVDQWVSFRPRVESDLSIPEPFDAVGEIIRAFLLPVARCLSVGDPFEGTWSPGGPWKHGTEDSY